jgi:hypothetical protein
MLLKLPRERAVVEGVKYFGIECGEFLEERARRLWRRRAGQSALGRAGSEKAEDGECQSARLFRHEWLHWGVVMA